MRNQKKVIAYDENNKKIKYRPHQLKGYYNGKSFFETVYIFDFPYFLEKEVSGPVNLYNYYHYVNSGSMYMGPAGGSVPMRQIVPTASERRWRAIVCALFRPV